MKQSKYFKNKAAEKQVGFKNRFKPLGYDRFEYILKDEDALKNQLIDWPGLIDEIERNKATRTNKGKMKNVFKNMLRSEHIPYNMFLPLKLFSDKEMVLGFFSLLIKRDDLALISSFEIEWSPRPREKYLSDNTSFDTYIEFILRNEDKLGVGIEVKYTEKSYPFGATELRKLNPNNKESPYFKVWDNSMLFLNDSYDTLGQKDLKQFFRNHLLGLSMINKGVINEFISVHLYPSGNVYQQNAAMKYTDKLIDDKKHFKAITFEEFIKVGRSIFNEENLMKWLKYLEDRYIVI